MYNRYIPHEQEYAPIPERSGPFAPPSGKGRESLLGKNAGRLKGLLKKLELEKLDSGDLLLLLVVLLLWREEEDLDLLIALGAALLLGEDT